MQEEPFKDVHAIRLIRSGVVLVFLGLVTGLAVPGVQIPRMAVSSHMEGVMGGVLLLALGLIWPRLELGGRLAVAGRWMLVFGAYANWGNTLLAAALGAGGTMMPFASQGRVGNPMLEALIGAVAVSMALSLLIGIGIVAWGSWRREG